MPLDLKKVNAPGSKRICGGRSLMRTDALVTGVGGGVGAGVATEARSLLRSRLLYWSLKTQGNVCIAIVWSNPFARKYPDATGLKVVCPHLDTVEPF